jgi:hypothetical protein
MGFIAQDISSGGLSLVKVDVPNIATNDNILTAPTSVDVATNITFTQTTAGITATLLNPTITTVNKTITLQNLVASTQSLIITAVGGDTFTIRIGQSIEVAWNGTSWKLLNPAQLLPETGTVELTANTGIGAGNSSVATAIVMPGMTFTAQSSGTFEVSIGIHSNQTSANQVVVAVLVKTSAPTIAIPNSETIIANAPSNGEFSGSKTFSVIANAGDIFQVRGFNNAGVASASFISNNLGRSTLYWNKISDLSTVSSVAGAVQGQLLFSTRIIVDQGNWILMDGRLKSTLNSAQQSVATALGMGTNIDDFRGRYIVGANGTFVLATPGGNNTLSQNQLPNVALGGTTDNQGSHTHGLTGRNYNSTGTPASPFNARGLDGTAVFNSSTTVSTDAAGNHTHNIVTGSINGGVTQQPLRLADLPVNVFMWLGASAQTVTVTQPLSLTTTGSGAATLNTATGVLNIPNASTGGSFLRATLATGQTTNIATSDHVKFETVSNFRGTDIILETTAYSTTANTSSIGRFILLANKTYELTSGISIGSPTTGVNYMNLAWHNATTNSPIVGATGAVCIEVNSTSIGTNTNPTTTAVFSPTVDTRVEVRVVSVAGVTSISASSTNFSSTYAMIRTL